MNPRVESVEPKDDYKLRLVFDSGEVRLYDCSHLLDFGVFTELCDETYFRRVRVVLGSVAWPHEQDICPDTLYEKSTPVAAMAGAPAASLRELPARSGHA